MNEGLFESSYGAPLKVRRVRYLVGQAGSSRYMGEAVVLGTTDNLSGQTTRYKGSTTSQFDRTDLVLQVPLTLGVAGGVARGGALMVQLPDGTIVGGNQRGYSAVDWQSMRGLPTYVAAGDYSVVGGGQNNRATGVGAVVGGGMGNAATGIYSTVPGGSNCSASGINATAVGGSGCSATASYSVVCGGQANSTDTGWNSFIGGGVGNQTRGLSAAIPGGEQNLANGLYSTISGGYNATTRTGYAAWAYASGYFASQGDAQIKIHVLRRSLAGALSNQPLYADGTTNTADYHISLPNDSTYLFEAHIVARRTDVDGESAAWIIRGAIDRGASAATTRLISTPTITEVARDAALNASVSVDADTTLGVLRVLATMTDTGKTVRFVAKVQTVEVVG